MKKILISAIVFVGLLMWSCQPDVNDLNSVSVIENIIGKWVATDQDGVGGNYQVEIFADPNQEDKILIYNFFNSADTAYAIVNQLELTLPNQQLGGYQIYGSGEISSDYQQITWTYYVDGEQVVTIFTPGQIAKKLISR